jgi:hypothetical protein
VTDPIEAPSPDGLPVFTPGDVARASIAALFELAARLRRVECETAELGARVDALDAEREAQR